MTIESIELKGWAGGLNREADPFLLDINESPNAINVDFGLRGELSKRKGYAKYTTDDSTSTAGDFLAEWTKLGGSQYVILTDTTGKLWFSSGSVLGAVLAGVTFGAATNDRDYAMAHASMNDKFYITSIRTGAAPHKYDGTTWSALTVSALAGAAGSFPRARALVQAHERMFAFNVKRADGADFRSRFYYSAALDPETWDALDYIDVAPDDGQEITTAVLFGEQIVIFKNHSMFALAGTSETNFTLYPIDVATGTECPGSVVPAGPELYFFDHLTGVWVFDGTQYAKIDDKINKYLLDGVNAAEVHKAHAFAYRGRYYLSVPWGNSTVNNRTFVYDGRIKAWTEYDFGWRGSITLEAEMYTSAPTSRVGIYKMWGVDADHGSNIDAIAETAWLSPAEPTYKHRLRRLDLAFSALGNFDVTLEMRRNFTLDAFVTQVINTSPGGALWDSADWDVDDFGSGLSQVLKRTTGWGTDVAGRWRVCQFVFKESTNKPFQVNRVVMQVSKLGRLRGEP